MKHKIFSSLGTALEWYDFVLYGFLGPILSDLYFPISEQSRWLSLIVTYGVFFIGYAARPLGALIFGYLGDKYGRILPLKITPLLITLTTFTIALLPTYGSIGILAPLLLIGIRIIQGVLLGGEFSGNMVYLCESTKKWRYLWGSVASCTGCLGILFASCIASYCYKNFNHFFLYNYGWRLAFFISVPLGIIVFFTRLKMKESEEFSIKLSSSNPIFLTLKEHKKQFAYSLGLIYLHATSFYFVFMFIPIFLTTVRHFGNANAFLNNSIFLFVHLLLIPIFGVLTNMFGGLRSIILTSLIFIILSIPCFYFVAFGTIFQLKLSLIIFSILTAANAAIIPALLCEIIPSNVRCTIVGLAFNLGFGVFGGIIPVLGLLMVKNGWSIASPSIYLSCTAIITFLFASNLKFSKGNYEIRKI